MATFTFTIVDGEYNIRQPTFSYIVPTALRVLPLSKRFAGFILIVTNVLYPPM